MQCLNSTLHSSPNHIHYALQKYLSIKYLRKSQSDL